MKFPMEDPEFKSKSCFCGICEYAAGECPIEGRWLYCDRNYVMELEKEIMERLKEKR